MHGLIIFKFLTVVDLRACGGGGEGAGARRSAIAVCSCVSTTTADTLCYGFTRVSRVYDIIRGFLKCCSLRCHTYKSCHAATNLPTNRSSRPHWPRVDVRVSAEGFES